MNKGLYCSDEEHPKIQALHGFGGDGLDFSMLRTHSLFKWSLVDLFGHGRSEKSINSSDFEVNAQVSLLMEHAKGDVLVGYSMGARLAIQAMVQYPGVWKALVLISGTAGLLSGREERLKWDHALVSRLRNLSPEDFWKYWMNLPIIATQKRSNKDFLRAREERRASISLDVLAASVLGFGAGTMPSIWDRLSELSIPVLLIVGEEDQKYVGIAKKLKQHMSNASVQMAVVEDAGHAPHFEQPIVCAHWIDQWVNNLPL